MKKLFKVLLVILLALALCACSKKSDPEPEPEPTPAPTPDDSGLYIDTSYGNYAAYTDYLVKVGDDKANLNYTYYLDEETGNYKLWLDNDSEQYFSRAYIAVFEAADSTESLLESSGYYLIRPLDYYKFAEQPFDIEPAYFDLYEAETYELNYEKGLKYDFYYGQDDVYGYAIAVGYDGELNDDVAMRIAKREYVIAVLTDLFENNIFMFNKDNIVVQDYNPVFNGAEYRAALDFTARTVSLYKGDELIKTENMD